MSSRKSRRSKPSVLPDDEMQPSPWYADGLRFRCTKCGNCCTGEPGFVWVDEGEIKELAGFLKLTVGEFAAKYVRKARGRHSLIEFDNGDCVFYDAEKGCTVYSARPKQCRTWPFWNSNLESADAWEEVTHSCPGAGHGKLYGIEEIQRQSAVVDV